MPYIYENGNYKWLSIWYYRNVKGAWVLIMDAELLQMWQHMLRNHDWTIGLKTYPLSIHPTITSKIMAKYPILGLSVQGCEMCWKSKLK